MIQTAEEMAAQMRELSEKRKSGDLDPKGYYKGLLSVLVNLADTLVNEVDAMDEGAVRAQIPMLSVLLDDQIRAFADRE